ncbi:T9SS-dependent choice-of-anchor J family protein [Nonlabens tegetincola]|uniref:T9SS-dependent choice-of-anchor J family protein n=1 Tax=Nonlabens tegetincola TaxID=323273 RepID=UPI000CF3C780|nr:choice-of-anchor J domain-containing protein [Nonlabens tegetincola]PQJ17273.1 hypothetical protein BST93_11545 [Nonlabens tegetincola]
MKTKLLVLVAFLFSIVGYSQCDYVLELTDNLGNDWVSGANLTANTGVDVTVAGVTTTFQIQTGNAGTPVTETYNITVNTGDAVNVDYRPTSFPGDGTFRLLDSEGIVLYDAGFNNPGGTALYAAPASCPTCPVVTALVVNNAAADSIELGWTNGGSESEWEIEFGVSPYTVGSGGTVVSATSNPFTVPGLTSETTYDFYVRAVCTPGTDISNSQGPIQGTTTESCPAPGAFAPITESAFEIQFTWDARGNSNPTFNVNYAPTGTITTPGTGQGQQEQQFTAPLAIVSGLMSDTEYEFWVQIDCGNGDLSSWSGPYVATTAISCPVVTGLTTSNIQTTSADISWTAGGVETEWEVEWAVAGVITNPGTGQGTTVSPNPATPSTSLSGLTDATVYEVYVRGICDPNLPDFSSWELVSFTTLCLPFSSPLTVDFETGFTPTTNTFPSAGDAFTNENCWEASSSANFVWVLAPGTLTASGGTGPAPSVTTGNYFYTEASSGTAGDTTTLVSPQVDLSGLTAPAVSFDYHMFGGDIGTLDVIVRTGGTDTNIFSISGEQQTSDTDPFESLILPLAAYAGQTVQVVFEATSAGTFEGDIAIDNVGFVEAPSCPRPLSLVVNSATSDSVELAWTNGGTETEWEIEYTAPGAGQGSGTVVTATTNPFTVSGLTDNTGYEFYIRAACSTTDFSTWTGPIGVQTLCLPFTAPAVIDFETGFTPTTNTFPGTADAFTSENCWEASSSGSFVWVLAPGTLTASGGTGPAPSITTGNYFYTEGSNGSAGDTTELVSPIYDLSALTVPAVSFDYHMFGGDIGTLELFIRAGGTDTSVFSISGEQQQADTDPFQNFLVSLNAFAGQSVQLVFVGTSAGTFEGDIAIDNIELLEAPACPTPFNFATVTNSSDSIEFSWTAGGSETEWEIEYTAPGAGQGSGTVVTATTNPFTVTGLTDNTEYDFYLRAICSTTDQSSWTANAVLARTACNAFSIPFTESFNSTSSTQDCWTVLDINGDGDQWQFDDTFAPSEGDESASMNTDFNGGVDDDYLISPAITLTGNERVRYDYRVRSANEPNDMEVLISTTGTNAADFTTQLLPVTQYSNTTYMTETIDLSAYSGDVYVAFRIPPNGTDGWVMYIDNVRFETIPSCNEPIAINTSNITTDAVDIDFTEQGTATSWEVEYGPAGFVLGTGTLITVTTNPFTLTGLIDNTEYDVYIRSACPSGGFSPWSVSTSFRTSCNAFSVPFNETFDSTSATQGCWTVLDENGDGDQWDLDYSFNTFQGDEVAAMNTDFNGGVDDDYLISPAITLTGGQRLIYQYRVQSANEPNDMEVLLSTTGNAAADFTNTIVPVNLYSNTTYQEQVVDLSSFTGDVYIAWRVPPNGTDGWRMYIDDVVIEDIPSCPEVSAITIGNITATGAEVSWTNGGSETEWDIEVVPAGTTPTGTPTDAGVTTNPYTLSTLTSGTDYDVYVRAVCSVGNTSPYEGPVTFTTSAVCGDTVYDTGGATGDYSNGENYTITYVPDVATNIVELDFTLVDLENCCDTLTIYDGLDTSAPVLEADLENPAVFQGLNTDGAITIEFTSDGSVTAAGWEASYNCIPRPSCVNVSNIVLDSSTASSLTVSWTDNNIPVSTAWEVVVLPQGSAAPVAGTSNATSIPYTESGLSADTEYDVYVRADCDTNFIGPVTFRTDCSPVTSYPYAADMSQNAPNNCWDEAGSGDITSGPSNFGASDWRDGRAYTDINGNVINSNAMNLYQSVDQEWLISEDFDLSGTSNDELVIEVAVTNWTSSGTSTASDTDTMGSDDQVDLMVSTDNGATWSSIFTWTLANQPAVTGTRETIDISAYTGITRFAIYATDGAVDDTEDYDFHVGVFEIDASASVDNTQELGFTYYPNPTVDIVNISAVNTIDSIVVTNLSGQQVVSYKPASQNAVVDLSTYSTGMYLLQVTSNGATKTVRVIKD